MTGLQPTYSMRGFSVTSPLKGNIALRFNRVESLPTPYTKGTIGITRLRDLKDYALVLNPPTDLTEGISNFFVENLVSLPNGFKMRWYNFGSVLRATLSISVLHELEKVSNVRCIHAIDNNDNLRGYMTTIPVPRIVVPLRQSQHLGAHRGVVPAGFTPYWLGPPLQAHPTMIAPVTTAEVRGMLADTTHRPTAPPPFSSPQS